MRVKRQRPRDGCSHAAPAPARPAFLPTHVEGGVANSTVWFGNVEGLPDVEYAELPSTYAYFQVLFH